MENQAGADPQTDENIFPKHVGALSQVQEKGLHQISYGGGTEVQNLFHEHTFRFGTHILRSILYICATCCSN